MQPTDHMSTAGVYLVDPISSSGGLGSQQKIDSNSAAKNQKPKCISPIDPKQPSSGLHNEVPLSQKLFLEERKSEQDLAYIGGLKSNHTCTKV